MKLQHSSPPVSPRSSSSKHTSQFLTASACLVFCLRTFSGCQRQRCCWGSNSNWDKLGSSYPLRAASTNDWRELVYQYISSLTPRAGKLWSTCVCYPDFWSANRIKPQLSRAMICLISNAISSSSLPHFPSLPPVFLDHLTHYLHSNPWLRVSFGGTHLDSKKLSYNCW